MDQGNRSESTSFYPQEPDDDRRTLRLAMVLAIVVHAVLFAVNLPEFSSASAEVKQTQVFMTRPIRFKPQTPARQKTPRPNARRVPIPDPTPNDPEPILRNLPSEQRIDLSLDSLLGDVPSPPDPPRSAVPLQYHSSMVRPERIAGLQPRYTEVARRARLEGVVILRAVITRQGDVRDVKIVKPLGLGLDEAAAETVRGWRFRPARLDGEPIDVIYSLTVKFNLR